MKKLLIIGIILIFPPNKSLAQETSEYKQLCRDVSELIIANNKSEFLRKFGPTKEDLLEFSYGTKADKVKKKEREGFFESVKPTIRLLEDNISTSFDFLYGKLDRKEILNINSVEIKKMTKSKIGETEVENLYFVFSDGENQFKVELLGIYKTSRNWIIMTDIAPGYF